MTVLDKSPVSTIHLLTTGSFTRCATSARRSKPSNQSTPSILKPLKVILIKLHERIEPELGDSFLRREARIHSMKKNLQCLRIGPFKPIIKIIVSDLDSELRKLAVSKLDHPAYRTVGKYNDLTTKIGPDDSSSIRKWLENRAEEARETK
ncbi:hypothetical protein BPAE_0107g00190 [Botrytis paeoniae]|uniref:Uncharacterized protein n=1 Tax=Botrytis paeoniae TaxID=278948 RepID=A0A4Z1FNA8_9HELO|nr:hypothetical protein BPAE_0107g00190 [Botrytis paeoniae]